MTDIIPSQLLLPLQKENLLCFDDFYADENLLALNALRQPDQTPKMLYIEGTEGTGKTHLCEATAEALLTQNKAVLFFSGKTAPPFHFFYDLPPLDYFILDDVDYLLGFSEQYEEALFSAFNQIFDQPQTRLLLSASIPVHAMTLRLKDLKSRLHSMLQLTLSPPSKAALKMILKYQARRMQFDPSEAQLNLLIRSLPPNAKAQNNILRALLESSLKNKKKLSIEYIKNFLKSC